MLTTSHVRSLVLALAGLTLTPSLFADQTGPGTNVVSNPFPFTTWTVAGSPYRVMNAINVNLLTIEPGVCVLVADSAEITVQTLTAVGTPEAPIVFAPLTPETSPSWRGLKFNGASATTELTYCHFVGSEDSAISLIDSTPTISECVFEDNRRVGNGGAIHAIVGSADLTVDGCTFYGNTATNRGGAVHADMDNGHTFTMRNCVVAESTANPSPSPSLSAWAGAIYFVPSDGSLVLDCCVFRDNLAVGDMTQWNQNTRAYGGAVFAVGGDVTIRTCLFQSNRALAVDDQVGGNETNHQYGGAIYFDSPGATLAVTNSVFLENDSYTGGSHPLGQGSAIYANNGSVEIENCTFSEQVSEALWCNDTANVLNSIFYFNNPGGFNGGLQLAGSGSIVVEYSDVQGGYAGTGNIAADPIFEPTVAGVIQVNSPCVDAGNPGSQHDDVCFPPSVSWFGIGGPRNDMGAFGGPGACAWADDEDWTDLGNGLAGTGPTGPHTGGQTPVLEGAGKLRDSSPVFLQVRNALPGAPTVLVLGLSQLNAFFQLGVMVPTVDYLIFLPTVDMNGEMPLQGTWPPDVPSGFSLYFQVWIWDLGGPAGFSATNGLHLATP